MLAQVYCLERVMGIEPTPSAWKAEVLPLNYTRSEPAPSWVRRLERFRRLPRPDSVVFSQVVEGEGFEPSKAEPTDLQSAPFDRSGTPPNLSRSFCWLKIGLSIVVMKFLRNALLRVYYNNPGGRAGVAQSVEQLPCKHQVGGSSPPASSRNNLLNNLGEFKRI